MFRFEEIFLLASFLLCSFSEAADISQCLESVEDGKDYFEHKVTPEESEQWSIEYFNTYKVVTDVAKNETYLLYQCGTNPPTDGDFTSVIPIPFTQFGLTQTTMIPFFELLGVRTKIAYYLGDSQFVSSTCLNELLGDGRTKEVMFTVNTTADELFDAGVPPDLPAFVPAIDSIELENLVTISASSEETNLAVYEWIKYYSVFFNLEGTANDLFSTTKSRYECEESNAMKLTSNRGSKPTVLWAYYSSYCGGWDVARCPNYYCEFAEACSANLLNSLDGSIESMLCGRNYMTTAEFVQFGKDAEYWIFPSSDWNSISTANKGALSDFVSVKAKQVYDYQGSGVQAWFENRLAEPDVVLQDFCAVVGTDNTEAPIPHERAWFRNVFSEAVGSSALCDDVSAPLVTKRSECVPVTSTAATSIVATSIVSLLVTTAMSAALLFH